jgi:hypothetical protein
LTTLMAFSSHLFCLQPSWLSTIYCTPCNHLYRASTLCLPSPAVHKWTSASDTIWCSQIVFIRLLAFVYSLQTKFNSWYYLM